MGAGAQVWHPFSRSSRIGKPLPDLGGEIFVPRMGKPTLIINSKGNPSSRRRNDGGVHSCGDQGVSTHPIGLFSRPKRPYAMTDNEKPLSMRRLWRLAPLDFEIGVKGSYCIHSEFVAT
jgi:hypothetical protein